MKMQFNLLCTWRLDIFQGFDKQLGC